MPKRPHVGLIGFSDGEVAELSSLFPSVRAARTQEILASIADPAELDLVVSVGAQISELYNETSCVLFGPAPPVYDSEDEVYIQNGGARSATSESFTVPAVPPSLERFQQRMATRFERETARGRGIVVAYAGPNQQHRRGAATLLNEALVQGAILLASNPVAPLASILRRTVRDRAIASGWFPNEDDRIGAVRVIAAYLAELGYFPPAISWQESARWHTRAEIDARRAVDEHETSRSEVLARLDAERAALDARVAAAVDEAGRGARRLLTAQSDELVAATIEAFESFGFAVENRDALPEVQGQPKGEDLRLRVPDDESGWEAIVEVKGEKNRTARGDHLYQLAKHALAYQRLTGRDPSKLILVHNGAFASPPAERPRPFMAAPDDIAGFAADGHLVVPTTDLFEMRRDLGVTLDAAGARRLIMESRGVLTYTGPAVDKKA